MKRIELIEFLKGYSIFTIVVFHHLMKLNLPGPFDKFIFFGGTGVHLFVLLSGLGLYLSYAKRPIPYLDFLKKRGSKIYIPYIPVVLFSALIALFIPIYENSWYALGGHAFLYKMFDESIIGSYGYPLWFVSMIFQFYIVFYLIARMKDSTKDSYFMIFCLAISICWWVFVGLSGHGNERIWNSFFLQYLWEFALGMGIASLLIKNNLYQKLKTFQYLLIGMLGCIIYASLAIKGGVIGKLFNDIPALIGYSCIAIWIYLLKIKPINNFFLFTGKISFSLYLVHFLIMLTLANLLGNLPILLVLVLSVILAYLVAYFYQNFIGIIYKWLKI